VRQPSVEGNPCGVGRASEFVTLLCAGVVEGVRAGPTVGVGVGGRVVVSGFGVGGGEELSCVADAVATGLSVGDGPTVDDGATMDVVDESTVAVASAGVGALACSTRGSHAVSVRSASRSARTARPIFP